MKLFYKTNRYGKYSITVTVVESWKKIQKQIKICYLKIYPEIKLKELLVIFILNHINNSFGSAIQVLPSDIQNTLTHILLWLL